MGSASLESLTTGGNNIAIGRDAMNAADGAESHNIMIGRNCAISVDDDGFDNNIGIGNYCYDGVGD